MKKATLAWIPALLLFAGAAFSQINTINYLPHKDMVFPQVVAGGQYETWVTVTNRGTQPWLGNLTFYTDRHVWWDLYVNGVPTVEGHLTVQIPAKATVTYKITIIGNIKAGYLVIRGFSTALDNFLEGNLTYYVNAGGQVVDSVGILPSNPVTATAIPFESFQSLCLAFANTDPQGRSANMTLTLFSETNVPIGTELNRTLINGEYFAQYLYQLFPTIPKTGWRGRLEIQSDVPVSMVALTQTESLQLSSLPLVSTTRTYALSIIGSSLPFAKMTLWADGLFVGGYGTVSSYFDVFGLSGQIAPDGSLHIHFDGNGNSAATNFRELYGIMKTDGIYTPGLTSFTGRYYVTTTSDLHTDTGTFTATLIP